VEPSSTATTVHLEKFTDILKTLSEQQTENVADALERLKIEDNVSTNTKIAIGLFRSQLQETLGSNINISQILAIGSKKIVQIFY
jgi:hypothetical protein